MGEKYSVSIVVIGETQNNSIRRVVRHGERRTMDLSLLSFFVALKQEKEKKA